MRFNLHTSQIKEPKTFRANKKIFFTILALPLLVSLGVAKDKEERNWENAKVAYEKTCAYCHDTGVGVESVKIKFPADSIESRAESIFYTVRHGLGAMPAFRQTEIDNQTLKELSTLLAKGEIK